MSNYTYINLEAVTVNPASRVLTLIQLIYGIPSMLLMIVFFFALGCMKTYSNSFYRLVQFDLTVNFFCHLNTWPAIRMESHPESVILLKWLDNTFPGILTSTKNGVTLFFHLQFCSAAALSLHRISALFCPITYQSKWRVGYIPFCIACIVYSYIPGLNYFGKATRVSFINGTLTKVFDREELDSSLNQLAVFSLVYFVLLITLGITTYIVLRKAFKGFNQPDQRVSKKLTKISLTYCFLYTGILAWSNVGSLNTHFQLFPDFFTKFSTVALVFASDLMTLALPYILLVFDTNVRRKLFARENTVNDNASNTSNSKSLFTQRT
ncbi:unnamed protein product [Caenorhabditis sp. 36 PRJEB53466]|nr:unnamed protein product [Caenorhabditis sp. 36 PRJEB53466]